MELHSNQKNAIGASLANNFASGVHFHATGTGKSWIALELIHEFQKANPKHSNIFWICEQKSILLDQFDARTVEARGYKHILKKFFVFDYSREKPADWSSIVTTSAFWGKPLLIIINRAFLVSGQNYKNIKIPIHLIIHDECHSITNKTSQEFYAHMCAANPAVRCIGFSATPVLQTPYSSIISKYTIYDACKDRVIVPPRIVWFKSEAKHIGPMKLRSLCADLFAEQPYQKVIVWCGMIRLCNTAAAEWAADPHFADWLIAVDTSADAEGDGGRIVGYKEFYEARGKAIMFCAGKHREGSDIPYLDTCVFMDNVAERNHKTFVQCVGRVLRRDPAGAKTHGLIIDVNARSPIEITNRMNSYLMCAADIFPYRYAHKRTGDININQLDIVCDPGSVAPPTAMCKNPTVDITSFWRRKCPDIPKYKERLAYELTLFYEKDLMGYLHHALEILRMTSAIPHVTRGSCGSSLVCYLLGISNTDPVKYNIQFARFLNRYRNTLPDIDFDFPHNLRDEVFLQIYLKWPNRVARISNHVYYHEKSAFRKAIQMAGIRKRIPALAVRDFVRKLPKQKREQIHNTSKSLENTFRTYMLHCGGIVFYPEGVPDELKLRESSVLSQVFLNKEQVSKNKQFKIDILSSRALTQLFEAKKFATIDFDAHTDDADTAVLFARGDNIGITLAESPLMRRTLLAIKPKNVDDIAKALAIIRPAAKKARDPSLDEAIIYDDDAISMIEKYVKCDAEAADNLRRILTKTPKKELADTLAKAGIKLSAAVLEKLEDLRKYGFCKSHAYSYAQLVWQLGYMKAHYPADFWRATLLHCQSSYRKWVHIYEAKLAGVSLSSDLKNMSIYAKHRRANLEKMGLKERVKSLGIWAEDTSFYPGCTCKELSEDVVELRGLIASSRALSYGKNKTVAMLVGYAPRKYVEVLVKGKAIYLHSAIGITCAANMKNGVLETDTFSFW